MYLHKLPRQLTLSKQRPHREFSQAFYNYICIPTIFP